MAQFLQDLAKRLAGAGALKGPGKGGGIGSGFLIAAGLVGYGVKESFYTVEGGHRAIIFSRMGGVQQDVYTEGLHFRIPWFQVTPSHVPKQAYFISIFFQNRPEKLYLFLRNRHKSCLAVS